MMFYVGLLTHAQKQAGYVVAQDDDFIFIFRRGDGYPIPVAVFPYETATLKEIRNAADRHRTSGTEKVVLERRKQ